MEPGDATSKRNRAVVSCTECHRRKQKCDRMLPCNDCSLRRVPQKCVYKSHVPTHELSKTWLGITKRRWVKSTQFTLSNESIVDLLGPGSADPFNSLPGGLGDETSLVHHYNTQFVNTRQPPGARKLWFPMALKDQAFYHSIMMVSAANITALRDKPLPPSFWYHRGKAIKEINNRLVQVNFAKNDFSIATIGLLCILDCLEMVIEGASAHQQALKRLVTTRGGLDKLGTTVQKLLRWTDLLLSIALVELPALQHGRLCTVDRSTYYHMYYELPSFSTIRFATNLRARLFLFTNLVESSDDVARIYWGLRNITILSTTESSTNDSYSLCFSDRCELLEGEVQVLLHRSLRASSRASNNHNLIFTLFARASLIYICSTLRELLMGAKIFQEVGNTLKESMDLGDNDLSILLSEFPDLLLWVLSLGERSVSLSHKVWFADMATRVMMVCQRQDDVAEDAARDFLWPEGRKNYDGCTLRDSASAGLTSFGF